MGKLIIDGNSIYEVDEACMKEKEQKKKKESEEEVRKEKSTPRQRNRKL